MILRPGSSTRDEPTKQYSWQKSICSEDRFPFPVGKHVGLGADGSSAVPATLGRGRGLDW